ncbi:MAG: hypothetical protein FLDDKLPJ_02210 [Phycisphaerae bacterium]|nr:hypothetical protein [Phycisphaerae bacterium]
MNTETWRDRIDGSRVIASARRRVGTVTAGVQLFRGWAEQERFLPFDLAARCQGQAGAVQSCNRV